MFNRILTKVIGCLLIIAFVAGSCKKFLAVEPPNSRIPTKLIFADDKTANAAMAGVYLDLYSGSFAGGGVKSMQWLAGHMADELHNNPQDDPGIIDFEQNNIKPENLFVTNIWTHIYQTIYQVNSILEELNLSTGVSPVMKDHLQGEALFIRALCHFYLVNMYGDVPLVTITDYKINSKVSRTPQDEVFAQVEKDLLEAERLMSDYDPALKRARPNKWGASALLSRFYLYRKNWQKAEDRATSIINNTAFYKLHRNLDSVFLNVSLEAIWQLSPNDLGSATNDGNAFLNPSENSSALTDTILHSFHSSDIRKIKWILKSGIFYFPYKYKLYSTGSDRDRSSEYSTVFRLSEQFLIRAEARAQLGVISGDNSAISDINIIRNRAGLPDTATSSLPQFMNILEQERKLELFTEWGHRWFDLKRWGKSTIALGTLKPNWNITDTILPIPQSELIKNINLNPQNFGY